MIDISKLLTKSGNINSRVIKEFMLTDSYKFLMDETSFLDDSSSLAERLFCYVNKLSHYPVCTCGRTITKFYTFGRGYSKHCSIKCSCGEERTKKIKRTKLDKYGDENWRNDEKIHATCLTKYGGTSPFHSSDIQKDIVETNLLKYGVSNVSKLEHIKEKKRLNTDYKKSSATLVETNRTKRHESEIYSILDDADKLSEMYSNGSIVKIANDFGIAFSTVNNYLIKHGIERNNWKTRSFIEEEISKFIEQQGFEVVRNSRSIVQKELDIFVPSLNFAIEIDGAYWHSCNNTNDEREYKTKHLNKTKMCLEKNISLFHIFDFEWNTKKDILKSMISSRLGKSNKIYAKHTKVSVVDSVVGKKFVDDNHLQGSIVGGQYVGLIDTNNTLVAVCQYGKSRFDSSDTEIYRFCNLANHNVVGGFSKIIKNLSVIGKIVSYANRRWSNGNMYVKTGFELINETPPNYYYWKNGKVFSRHKFMKHKLQSILNTYDDSKTEAENMYLNSYRKLYDCGNLKFCLHK